MENRSLLLVVKAKLEGHRIDWGAGGQAKKCYFCFEQILLVVVAAVAGGQFGEHWWASTAMEIAEALEAGEERAVVVKRFPLELVALS